MEKVTKVTVRKEQPEAGQSIETFISQAIQTNASVETMEKLFGLYKDIKTERAKEAFVKALSDFQRDCPAIEKTKEVLNKDGKSVRYKYAPLDVITDQIKKPLSDNGLSYTWQTKNSEGMITAIATITHTLGHSESSDFAVPVDSEGFMTKPQKYASALTFAKRYSLINVLGLSTGDEDTDATDVGVEPDAKSVKSRIVFLLRQLGDEAKTKELIEASVKTKTQLDLKDENFGEIIARLELLVEQKNEIA